MGDTGSLGLGGAIAGMAVLTRTELLLIVIGGLFVIEALSVIAPGGLVQAHPAAHAAHGAAAPPLRGSSWSETKIIVRFWIVAAIFAGLGFAIYYATF